MRALGLPLDSATHTKVRRNIVKSGLDASHLVRTRKRAIRTRRWSEAQLQAAVEQSTSIAMVARALGIVAAGGENLRILCPNCPSLQPIPHRGLNKRSRKR